MPLRLFSSCVAILIAVHALPLHAAQAPTVRTNVDTAQARSTVHARTTSSTCDWEAEATPGHRDSVRTALQPMVLLVDGMSGASGVDAASRQAALDLLRRAERPLPLGSMAGNWKVRSIQVHGADARPGFDFAYAYPYFKAAIQRKGACGYRFAKTSGSQRRTGMLYPMAESRNELAFLGAATVNNDPAREYDPRGDAEHASVGRLLRTGRNELLLILDAQPTRFELYQLRR